MELRHLRYFAAVAEDLSFRRAARHLHVSHPSLSQQINDLENDLSLKLFKRNSRQVELTEVGRVFLAGARQTLSSAQKAVAQAQLFHRQQTLFPLLNFLRTGPHTIRTPIRRRLTRNRPIPIFQFWFRAQHRKLALSW